MNAYAIHQCAQRHRPPPSASAPKLCSDGQVDGAWRSDPSEECRARTMAAHTLKAIRATASTSAMIWQHQILQSALLALYWRDGHDVDAGAGKPTQCSLAAAQRRRAGGRE